MQACWLLSIIVHEIEKTWPEMYGLEPIKVRASLPVANGKA